MKKALPLTARTTDAGHLEIGGVDVMDLVERHGTPLFVLDRATFETRARSYAKAVPADRVYYAGKALCCVAICELVDSLGLGLDVCSGGELHTALAAGFPPERIIFHGNNKSEGEIRSANDAGVGRIVVDSFDEIELLARIGVSTKLLVRLTPGVEAHTHEFVQTGQEDSKFGFGLADGIALEAVKRTMDVPNCELVGVHAHIGSQIFELTGFDLAIRRLAGFLDEAKRSLGFEASELNLGGGLGIVYTDDDVEIDPDDAGERILTAVEREFGEKGLTAPAVFLEPGRSIVGPAAVTLYRIGTVKEIAGIRTYVAVDGGMSDNIRPALYGSRYEAFLADRVEAPPGPLITVAGKHCESGDILIKDVALPDDVAPGDILCVPATGAYNYSMANNYNRIARPPIVLVDGGSETVIIERETIDDLLKLDRRLDGSRPA